MKKIGILLNSTTCNKYLFDTVKNLSQCKDIELYFLLDEDIKAEQSAWQKLRFKIKSKGIRRTAAVIVFKAVAATERSIFSKFISKAKLRNLIRKHKKKYSIDSFAKENRIHIKKSYSHTGLFVRYKEKDIKKIEALGLDFIVRGNSSGIFKGDILKAAKEGIISFHHGDNRWNRGGAPGFWEVYKRKPSTGFVIQILSSDLDGGTVLKRGNFPTLRTYTENVVQLYSESNPHLSKTLIKYAATDTLPAANEKLPYDGPLFRVPSVWQSITYIFLTLGLFIKLIWNRLVLNKRGRWGIAYCTGSWQDVSLRKGNRVKNPPGRFFADPFLFTKNNTTVCFVEDYNYQQKKACITAIHLIDRSSYEIIGPVIEEPFHMSFPFLFEYENELFMVPETSAANSIRLYKCKNFPLKWEYQKDLLSDLRAVDSMIFSYQKRWWLLTNETESGTISNKSALNAYYTSDPISGDWTAHDFNPLILDSEFGRNAGLLNGKSKNPVRVRQRQAFNSYGAGFSLARILELTPSSFIEDEIIQIRPDFFPDIEGCHHMHSDSKFTVFDYLKNDNLR